MSPRSAPRSPGHQRPTHCVPVSHNPAVTGADTVSIIERRWACAPPMHELGASLGDAHRHRKQLQQSHQECGGRAGCIVVSHQACGMVRPFWGQGDGRSQYEADRRARTRVQFNATVNHHARPHINAIDVQPPGRTPRPGVAFHGASIWRRCPVQRFVGPASSARLALRGISGPACRRIVEHAHRTVRPRGLSTLENAVSHQYVCTP